MDEQQTLISKSKSVQMIVTGLTFCLLFWLIRQLYLGLRFVRHFKNFPQDKGHFLLGNLKQLLPSFPFPSENKSTSTAEFLLSQRSQRPNDGVFVFWLSWYPVVTCTDYRSTEAVLSKPNHDKGYGYKFLGLRDGLVVSHGPKWKARRRMIEPFFNSKSLSTYLPAMNQSFTSMTKDMTDQRVSQIDMASYIHTTSVDIIFENTMSVPIVDLPNFKKVLLADLEEGEKIVIARILNPFLYLDWTFNLSKVGQFFKQAVERIDNFMQSRIKERLMQRNEKIDNNGNCDLLERKSDFIDLLLDHYDENSNDQTKSINMEGMKEEILNLIIAGHDTIATGLRWTLFLLGNNLNCQDKLYEEIANHLDENGSDYCDNLEGISKLTYLDQCIKESMRLFPPIPLLARRLETEVTVDQYTIPKGTALVFSYYHIHRDSKVWENPDTFDPDRFEPDRFASIPKYAYIPFGNGKRSCIGQRFAMIEMKLFIIHLMRKYRFISTQSVDQVKFEMDVTIKPTQPLTIKLFPRN